MSADDDLHALVAPELGSGARSSKDPPLVPLSMAICRMMKAAGGIEPEVEDGIIPPHVSQPSNEVKATWENFVGSRESSPVRTAVDTKQTARSTSSSPPSQQDGQASSSKEQYRAPSRSAKPKAKGRARSASRPRQPLDPQLEAKLDALARERLASMPKELLQAAMLPPEIRDTMSKSMVEFMKMIDNARAPILKGEMPSGTVDDIPAEFLAQIEKLSRQLGMVPHGSSIAGSRCPALAGSNFPASSFGSGTSPSALSTGFEPPSRVQFPDEEQRKLVASNWREVEAKRKLAKSRPANIPTQTSAGKTTTKSDTASKQVVSTSSKMGSLFKGFASSSSSSSKSRTNVSEREDDEGQDSAAASSSSGLMDIMQDFEELAKMNAGITGVNMTWFVPVLKSFGSLVAAVVNADEASLENICDLVSLELSHVAKGRINFKEFSTPMLASLRSLFPLIWDSNYETAWIKVWQCISTKLQASVELPAKYNNSVNQYIAGLSDKEKKSIGSKAFDRLFKEEPKAERYFKQSNARLAFIVALILDLTAAIFAEPEKVVAEVTQLGLKHIMFQAEPAFFQNFVSAIVSEVQVVCKDPVAVEGVNWALCVIACLMVRTMEQGSTPLLRAVVNNNVKEVKKALNNVGRAARSEAVLGSR